MRKSFIIHFDALDVLDELTDEQAGQLFKAISQYQKTGKNDLKGVMNAVFIPFKNQFDRDKEKYDSICERNKINGLKGGRPKPKETQKTQGVISGTQKNPNKPDNKNDNDSKNKNDNKKEVMAFEGEVIRISMRDWDTWEAKFFNSNYEKMYKYMDSRDNWLAEQSVKIQKNWFMSTKSDLEKNYA